MSRLKVFCVTVILLNSFQVLLERVIRLIIDRRRVYLETESAVTNRFVAVFIVQSMCNKKCIFPFTYFLFNYTMCSISFYYYDFVRSIHFGIIVIIYVNVNRLVRYRFTMGRLEV